MLLNWSRISNRSPLGRLLRLPLRLVPARAAMSVMAGPNRGMRWRAGAFDHGCWLGSFELEKQVRLQSAVTQGMTAYDLGAHAGFYTLLLSRAVGPTGRVFAFEPYAANAAQLLEHLRLNRVENVILLQTAIGSASGLAWFRSGSSSSTGALSDGPGNLRVPCFTLDQLIDTHGLPEPDLLKVDVEGAEAEVLRGSCGLLHRRKPIWFIALHSGANKTACLPLLAAAGYDVFGLDGLRCDASSPLSAPDDIVAIGRGSDAIS